MKKYYALFFLLFSHVALAWPLFTAPSFEDSQNADQVLPCENTPKEFRIKAGALIPVRVETYWPVGNWHWESRSVSPCFSKNRPLPIRQIDIDYVKDDQGLVRYSIIHAHFLTQSGSAFTLTLKTPKEYWFCLHENKLKNYIICANDMKFTSVKG